MRCFTILGPAASGKSTLVEALARLEGTRPEATEESGVRTLSFPFVGEQWFAIDCPGGAEALPEARQTLLASDVAVICVPPDPEQAVLAAPYLKAVEEAGTPSILFVNRMDEARGRVRDIVAALQDYVGHAIVLRQVPIREGGQVIGAVDLVSERAWRYQEGRPSALIEIPDTVSEREREARSELLEHLSDFDDWLLEEIVEDREPAAGPLYAICTRTVRENRVIPALIGAAGRGSGMVRLMKALRHEAPPVEVLRQRLVDGCAAAGGDPLLAVAFQARQRRHVGKVTLVRALADGLASGGRLGGGNLGGLAEVGSDRKVEGSLPAGAVAVAVKADQLAAGRLATREATLDPPPWARPPMPMVARLIVPARERDDVKLSGALARLAEVDPGLVLEQDEQTGAFLAHVQGPTHLRTILHTLAEEYGVEAREAVPPAVFRESITRSASIHHRHRKQTGGAGQFADVKLTVAPNPRGTGFTFDETVKGGAVPRNRIPAVEAGARDAMARGPLGFQVIDIAVTLTDGQYHSVDSSDFAFRTAARAGVLEALAEAVPVLLQPIRAVTFHVPSVHSGALVPLVASAKGRVLGFDRDPDAKGWDVFRALLPASALDELAQALRGATQGVGSFESEFDHFEEMYGREAEQVVTELRATAASA